MNPPLSPSELPHLTEPFDSIPRHQVRVSLECAAIDSRAISWLQRPPMGTGRGHNVRNWPTRRTTSPLDAAGSGAGVPDPEPQFPPDPDYDERSSIVFEEFNK